MGDTQHANDFPELMIDQIRELAETVCEVFGGNLSQKDFSDKLLMFLGDVPGCETGEVAAALLESVWAEYASDPEETQNFTGSSHSKRSCRPSNCRP